MSTNPFEDHLNVLHDPFGDDQAISTTANGGDQPQRKRSMSILKAMRKGSRKLWPPRASKDASKGADITGGNPDISMAMSIQEDTLVDMREPEVKGTQPLDQLLAVHLARPPRSTHLIAYMAAYGLVVACVEWPVGYLMEFMDKYTHSSGGCGAAILHYLLASVVVVAVTPWMAMRARSTRSNVVACCLLVLVAGVVACSVGGVMIASGGMRVVDAETVNWSRGHVISAWLIGGGWIGGVVKGAMAACLLSGLSADLSSMSLLHNCRRRGDVIGMFTRWSSLAAWRLVVVAGCGVPGVLWAGVWAAVRMVMRKSETTASETVVTEWLVLAYSMVAVGLVAVVSSLVLAFHFFIMPLSKLLPCICVSASSASTDSIRLESLTIPSEPSVLETTEMDPPDQWPRVCFMSVTVWLSALTIALMSVPFHFFGVLMPVVMGGVLMFGPSMSSGLQFVSLALVCMLVYLLAGWSGRTVAERRLKKSSSSSVGDLVVLTLYLICGIVSLLAMFTALALIPHRNYIFALFAYFILGAFAAMPAVCRYVGWISGRLVHLSAQEWSVKYPDFHHLPSTTRAVSDNLYGVLANRAAYTWSFLLAAIQVGAVCSLVLTRWSLSLPSSNKETADHWFIGDRREWQRFFSTSKITWPAPPPYVNIVVDEVDLPPAIGDYDFAVGFMIAVLIACMPLLWLVSKKLKQHCIDTLRVARYKTSRRERMAESKKQRESLFNLDQ